MKTLVYRATCLTNLHMGSGDFNYSVIDLEVEKDPVMEVPVMNSSSVKGALKDHYDMLEKKKETPQIFGDFSTAGGYRFLSGDMLARPLRVSEGNVAWVLATSPSVIQTFLNKAKAFGWNPPVDEKIPEFEENQILTGSTVTEVEGLKVERKASEFLNYLLDTENWVLMSHDKLKQFDLPVQAHNVLDEDGKSQNLWYEENVPHESVFGLIILPTDNVLEDYLKEYPVVQFGAGASTGYGFMRLERLVGKK